MVLSSHKEERFAGVERHSHHATTVLPERVLCGLLGKLVHQYRLQRDTHSFRGPRAQNAVVQQDTSKTSNEPCTTSCVSGLH